MEKPYRYMKKLVKMGHSSYVLVPDLWLVSSAKGMGIKQVIEVIVEVYSDRIVITPNKGK